jgi:hypothetical protein
MSKPAVATEKFVCRSCIADSGLQEVVDRYAANEKCSYCNARKSVCLEYVLDRIKSAIGTVYGPLEDNLDVNGKIPDDHYEIDEVFKQIGFRVNNEELQNDIESAFDGQFYTEDRQTSYVGWMQHEAWDNFKTIVKHKRRYTFPSYGEHHETELDELLWSSENVLANIAKLIFELSLVKAFEPGTAFWRVRVHDTGEALEVPKDYTSPPAEYANYSNRMSPAGVPMFYGADDFETAMLETTAPEHDTANKVATGIQFVTKVKLSVLDLTELPESDTFFSDWDLRKRMGIGFLSSFVADVSKPIKKDGREHIEYVPTQVFTEFVRHQIEVAGNDRIDGIRYRSSKNGRACIVLFVEQAGCLPQPAGQGLPQVLEAVPGSLQTAVCKWCLPGSAPSGADKRAKDNK